jgi:AraC family transcriptional regulator
MPNAIQDAWRKIVTEFFLTAEYKPTCELDIEAYTDGNMDAPDYYSEIWVPVEKK